MSRLTTVGASRSSTIRRRSASVAGGLRPNQSPICIFSAFIVQAVATLCHIISGKMASQRRIPRYPEARFCPQELALHSRLQRGRLAHLAGTPLQNSLSGQIGFALNGRPPL